MWLLLMFMFLYELFGVKLPRPESTYVNAVNAPEQIATKDDTEHKDEQANAQHDDIDVEWQMVQVFGRHIAV